MPGSTNSSLLGHRRRLHVVADLRRILPIVARPCILYRFITKEQYALYGSDASEASMARMYHPEGSELGAPQGDEHPHPPPLADRLLCTIPVAVYKKMSFAERALDVRGLSGISMSLWCTLCSNTSPVYTVHEVTSYAREHASISMVASRFADEPGGTAL